MKSKKFLFGIVVVLLMVTLVLPSCNNALPPVEADELVIPSSLQPYEVSEEIFPEYPPFPYGTMEWKPPEDIDWPYIACVAPEQGFIEGFLQEFLAHFYIMRNGTRASDEGMALRFIVLKYQTTEFAEGSYIHIGKAFELEDLTYHGIALKSGPEYVYKGEKKWWGISNPPSYLIHSGCFVIYFFGRDDVTKDALDRIIVAFGVKE
jgi:hypothetical protein